MNADPRDPWTNTVLTVGARVQQALGSRCGVVVESAPGVARVQWDDGYRSVYSTLWLWVL